MTFSKLIGATLLASVALAPMTGHASAVMTLKGTVFSILRDEFVIQSGRELFYLKKDALPQDTREQFEKASAHEITVDVPMTAITKVRTSQDEKKH
jgi:hypothetical protein